jgi:hypothetical protein
MVDANGMPYDNRVNNVAEDNKPKQEYEDGGRCQPEPLPSFKLVSNSDSAPAQSCSPATIENALQFLYNKIMTDAINKIKQTLKPSFCRPYLTVNLQNCTSINGLYDTGVDISCVSEKFFHQLPPIVDLPS